MLVIQHKLCENSMKTVGKEERLHEKYVHSFGYNPFLKHNNLLVHLAHMHYVFTVIISVPIIAAKFIN